MLASVLVGALGAGACGGVQQRFPDDVQASLAHGDMRRLETERFLIYYPAHRRAEVDRFLARAQRCVDALREAAVIHDGPWRDKMVIAMPEAAFNNAFVLAEAAGYEHVSVIPMVATLDLTTEFGIPPDPGLIACHELTHYVQLEQVAGFWKHVDRWFGHIYTPQLGYDPWFLEGLATHYEAALSPGVGRPRWPIFTGMFAAAYAGRHVGGGDMSALGRRASVGHHYLVGTMFVRFLTERYGEPGLWRAVGDQAHALDGWFFTGSLREGFGASFTALLDEFDAWCAASFPVRRRPAGQRTLATLGNDARYARGRDGTEAWVANDVDVPTHLVVRDATGATLADIGLVDVVPPRTLVQAEPLVVSGLSVTADGREVWLTTIDLGATYQVPRLLRWRRGDAKLTEVSHALGPGATIDPRGETYYYCEPDGDRWSLAAWDVRHDRRRTLIDAPPGTYVLGAQVSADGARLIASVWNGTAFVAWVLDAATGARLAELGGAGTPIYDASFTDDGRAIYLGEVDGRFQLVIDGRALTDAPYAVLAPRSTAGTIRFLNRDGWEWTLDEVPLPTATTEPAPSSSPVASEPTSPASPPPATPAVLSDQPYSPWEHFWFPQLRSPVIVVFSSGLPHLGVVLGGGDRLGMQRWSISGYAQPPGLGSSHTRWGGDAEYLNTMLAPWRIIATAGLVDWSDPISTDDPQVFLAEDRRTRDASLSLSRTWRETLTTTLSTVYTDDFDRPPNTAGFGRHLGGPSLSLAWASVESTPYTGARRAVLLDASAAYYPHALSTFTGDIYDTGGAIGAIVPLPLGRRHILSARLRGRALLARDDTDLLQVGGDSGIASLWTRRSISTDPPGFDSRRFPPNLRFIEPLRGYDDYAITTDRAALADLAWRYPLIIDRGVAATLGFLPASFLRQLDLELFASGALDRHRNAHAAAGAAISLSIVALRVPLLVTYQIARRLRDDEALTQLVGVALGL